MKSQKKTNKSSKNRNKDDKDQEELPVDLTFCFQANIILNEAMKKAEYIGAFTTSNSKNAMSKVIGNQIYNKLKKQEEFEKVFQNLIAEKAKKINLIQFQKIINIYTSKSQNKNKIKNNKKNKNYLIIPLSLSQNSQ